MEFCDRRRGVILIYFWKDLKEGVWETLFFRIGNDVGKVIID
jgi:hypothetical protein